MDSFNSHYKVTWTSANALAEVPVVEKQQVPGVGGYWLPLTGGWLSADVGQYMNWWQLGANPIGGFSRSAMVEACVSAYSQTMAMCPGDHWKSTGKGGRERVETSALSRILRVPNSYQSPSDFMLNLVRNLYLDGNAYALALRNNRFEITELHLMNSQQSTYHIATTGDIFYYLQGNEIIERQIYEFSGYPLGLVPARDVLHVKLHTPRHPLKGETPLMATAMDTAANDAIMAQQIAFFLNQARPSTVLATELNLDKDTVTSIRDRWNQQTKGLNAGGTPILTAGLKPVAMPQITSRDAQLAEVLKASEQHIALAFRAPLQMFGMGGTPFSSTEALMQSWIATGLGFCANHVEEAFGLLFELQGQPWEYLEFDMNVLLRSLLKDRIEAYTRGVQGGVYAPNEARAEMELDAKEFGDEPRVQQQVVPLSAAGAIPKTPASPPAPPQPPQPPSNAPKKGITDDYARTVGRSLLIGADDIDRRRLLSFNP